MSKELPSWATPGTKVLVRSSGYKRGRVVEATITRVSKTSAWTRTKGQANETYERRWTAPRWNRGFENQLEEYGRGSSYASSYAVHADSPEGQRMLVVSQAAAELQRLRDSWAAFDNAPGSDTAGALQQQLADWIEQHEIREASKIAAT